jgi:hypothetical protein
LAPSGNKGAKLFSAITKLHAPKIALHIIDDAIQANGAEGAGDFALAVS